MRFLARLLIALFLLGNLLMMGAVSMHVVRTPTTFVFVPKSQLTLMETYVDTRNWTAVDLKAHAALVQRLTQEGKQDALSHVTATNASGWNLDSSSVTPVQKDAGSTGPRPKSIFDIEGKN